MCPPSPEYGKLIVVFVWCHGICSDHVWHARPVLVFATFPR